MRVTFQHSTPQSFQNPLTLWRKATSWRALFGNGVRSVALFILFPFLFASCEKNYYVSRSASLTFSPTTQVTMLHAALNGLNEFVTIRLDKGYYVFTNAAGQQARWPMTEIDKKTTYVGLSGFIVGCPTLGDGTLGQQPTCFELACPLCYEERSVTRDVTLGSGENKGKAICPSCHTTFDLNMADPGLDRYQLSYSGPPTFTLTIR